MATQDAARSGLLLSPPELGIVAAGSGLGQKRSGVETAPSVIMSGQLFTYLRRSENMTSHGDVNREDCAPLHEVEHYEMSPEERASCVSAITRGVSQRAYEHAMSGRMVLTLGGDHSVTIGSICGVSKAIDDRFQGEKRLGVICVGAHAGIKTRAPPGSENVQSMPLALVSGLVTLSVPGAFEWIEEEHLISPDKLVYIGLREIGDAEGAVIEDHNIKYFKPYDITHKGIKDVMDEALQYLGSGTPIHLSFDIRGLDQEVAPSTGTPVLNGLTAREGTYVCERLAKGGQLVSMDLVEVNPRVGTEADKMKTLEAAFMMIVAGLSGIY